MIDKGTADLLVAFGVVVMCPALAMAQGGGMLETLARSGELTTGDSVRVAVSAGRMKAVILEVRPTELVLMTDAGHLPDPRQWRGRRERPWTVEAADIVSIERRGPLKNGALWGMVIGWVSATAWASHGCDYEGEPCGLLAAVIGSPGAGIGAGVGALVDALVWEDIYRRTPASRVTLTPQSSQDAVGARLTVRW